MFGSLRKISRQSTKLVPLKGSPPIPECRGTQRHCKNKEEKGEGGGGKGKGEEERGRGRRKGEGEEERGRGRRKREGEEEKGEGEGERRRGGGRKRGKGRGGGRAGGEIREDATACPEDLPTHRDWPNPALVVCQTASYVSVPDRDTIPVRVKQVG